jgi:hypothetical protein
VSRGTVAVVSLAVVVSAGAVAYAGRPAGALPTEAGQARTVPVSTVALSCPGGQRDRQASTRVVAVSPGQRSGGSTGTLAVVPLERAAGPPLARSHVRGSIVSVPLAPQQPPVVVEGTGSLATGVTAGQWSRRGGSGHTSGSDATWCQQPDTEWWFAGADTSAGNTSSLVLSNPSTAVAVVDLALYDTDGKVLSPAGRGIAVAPMSRRSLDLSHFAPGQPALTVNVHAEQGEVAAAVYSARGPAAHPIGSEWVPASAVPSRRVLVDPASPGRADQRLVITNPTAGEALVQAGVLDTSGQFTPVGFTDIRIPPGEVKVLDLGSVTHGSTAAVRLSSSSPVLAATITYRRHGPARDYAVAAAGHQIDDPAVVPVVAPARLSLSFVTSTPAGASASIATYDAQGRRLSNDRVQVAGRVVTTWRLPRGTSAAYVVVTNTGHAPGLQGVADYVMPGAVLALPVLSGLYTVARPAVASILTYP